MKNPFASQGLVIDGIVFLSPQEALPFLLCGAILVDLREGLARNGRTFQVPHVLDVPYAALSSELPRLPRDRPLILADCVGIKSKLAARILRDAGFGSIACLNGGMVAWQGDGLPIAIDDKGELSGGCACRLRPRKPSKPRFGC